MPCTDAWSYKAKNRTLQIQITPAAGSNPTAVELGLRTVDLGDPPQPTTHDHFNAAQLAAGVPVPLRPNRRYELALVVIGSGESVVVNLAFDDGTVLVPNETCTRGQWPITGRWTLTTWKV